jgi:hypothetical protein
MANSRRESIPRNGITDTQNLQLTSATKSAKSDILHCKKQPAFSGSLRASRSSPSGASLAVAPFGAGASRVGDGRNLKHN